MTTTVSRTLIKSLAPLSSVEERYLDELLTHCYLKPVPAGGVVLRKKEQDRVKCYLIEGQVDVWHSFEEREFLDQSSPGCRQPLNDLLHSGSVIRAATQCRILRVNNNVLERLLTLGDAGGEHPDTGPKRRSGPDYFDKAMTAIFRAMAEIARTDTDTTAMDKSAPAAEAGSHAAKEKEAPQEPPAEPDMEVDNAVRPLRLVAR